MWYAIIATDHADSLSKRQAARPQHLERLHALLAQGRLRLAGPFPAIDSKDPGSAGFHGSLIVAEFDDLASAHAWAKADPYLAAGVYADVRVEAFVQALP
ncbi:MAG: YciI family protein [Xanthomonadales bacterium]|nr:YciI family protein [Xanthomonadales bacterium]